MTVNPAHWEGDFRLWESFATGALVMVDPLFVPHTNPLIDKVHVVYFSNDNKTDLFNKLDYYRQHKGSTLDVFYLLISPIYGYPPSHTYALPSDISLIYGYPPSHIYAPNVCIPYPL